MQGCEYTAYHKLARSDPDFGGGGSSSVWVYLNQHEGDNSKCTSWAQDCCASLWWGEAQTCADGYVAVKVDDSVYEDWEHCPDYGRYTCMPGDPSKCSSPDGGDGHDCCASEYWGEPQTCFDDYTPVETHDFCWYALTGKIFFKLTMLSVCVRRSDLEVNTEMSRLLKQNNVIGKDPRRFSKIHLSRTAY